ncbi:hypothetical protein ACQRIT_002879 [Beauveria bassiana]
MSSFTRNSEDADKVQQWKEFYQSWHEIVGSRDDEAFEERLQRLKDRYNLDHAREVGYIIETWLDLYKEKLVKQIRTPIELSGTLYSSIRGWVSHEALRKVEEQRKRLLKNGLPDCTGVFTATFGLPIGGAAGGDIFPATRRIDLFSAASSAYAAIATCFAIRDSGFAVVTITRDVASIAGVIAHTGHARYSGDTLNNKVAIQDSCALVSRS